MDPSFRSYGQVLQGLPARMAQDHSSMSAMGSEFMGNQIPRTSTAEAQQINLAESSSPRRVPLYERRGHGCGRKGGHQELGANSTIPVSQIPPGLGNPTSSNASLFSMLNLGHRQNELSGQAMGNPIYGNEPYLSSMSNDNDWRHSPDRGASSSLYGSQRSTPDWPPLQSQLYSSAQGRPVIDSIGSGGVAASLSPFNIPGRFTPASFFGPTLNVYLENVINFSNCDISFRVQAINLPLHVPLDAYVIDGIVVTPSGKLLLCQIKLRTKTNIHHPDSFIGTFKSTDELGIYQLRVWLIFPIFVWGTTSENGVIADETQIRISRNNPRMSLKKSVVSFQVEFEPWRHFSWSFRSSVLSDRNRAATYGERSVCKVWGLACDKGTDRLFYTDRTGNSFSCLDSERGQTIFKVSPSNPNGVILKRPTGICCDEVNRRVLVADKDNHRVCIFSMSGQFLTCFGRFGHANGEFNYPWDVAVSLDGSKIAVSDSRNKRLQLFNKHGMFMGKFSVFETRPYEYKNNFDYPRGVTFNKEGTLIYMSDFNADNIMEVPIDMKSYRKVLPEGKLKRPQGLVVDPLDSILVCDSKNKCVRHIDTRDGEVLAQINSIGRERLKFPVNMALLGDGRLAVLDANAKIRIV